MIFRKQTIGQKSGTVGCEYRASNKNTRHESGVIGRISRAAFIAALVLIVCMAGGEKARAYDAPTIDYSASTGVTDALGYFNVDDVYYLIAKKPSGGANGKVYASGCNDDVKTIKIPKIAVYKKVKYDVLGVNDNGFNGKNIETVEIEGGMTLIAPQAFYGCPELKSVKIGSGLTQIDEYAFAYCPKLKTVKLPDTVKKFGTEVFAGCTSLESVNCPESLTTIPRGTFSGCSALKSFSFGKKIKTVEERAFSYCSSMTKVVFDKALTTIGDFAFDYCESLKDPKFTLNIKDVGFQAFGNCKSIETLKLNKKFTVIPNACFVNCEGLKKLTLSSKTVSIGGYAFSNCYNLEKIKGNNTKLKTVGESAFSNTWHLEGFKFAQVEEIGESAFSNSHVMEADLGDKLKKLGENAFSYSGVRSVVIPGTLKEIPKRAFDSCYWLEKAVLKDGVEKIGESAFEGCSEMTSFTYTSSVNYVSARAMESTRWLEHKKGKFLRQHRLTEPGYNTIEGHYFNSFDYYNEENKIDYSRRPEAVMINDICIWVDTCDVDFTEQGYWRETNKKVIDFPSDVRMVSALINATTADEIVFPVGTEIIAGMINMGDYGSTPFEFSFPSSLKKLECRFSGERFTSITLPSGLEEIGEFVFSQSRKLSDISFTGKSLKKIGNYAFQNTTSLEKIELPSGLEELSDFAFFGSEISEISLPSTLKRIGDNCFVNTKLTKIDLNKGLEEIGERAFAVLPLKEVKLPDSIRRIGAGAFSETGIKKIALPDKFEIANDMVFDENVVFVVKKNSKAHKALLEFAKNYRSDYWKIELK